MRLRSYSLQAYVYERGRKGSRMATEISVRQCQGGYHRQKHNDGRGSQQDDPWKMIMNSQQSVHHLALTGEDNLSSDIGKSSSERLRNPLISQEGKKKKAKQRVKIILHNTLHTHPDAKKFYSSSSTTCAKPSALLWNVWGSFNAALCLQAMWTVVFFFFSADTGKVSCSEILISLLLSPCNEVCASSRSCCVHGNPEGRSDGALHTAAPAFSPPRTGPSALLVAEAALLLLLQLPFGLPLPDLQQQLGTNPCRQRAAWQQFQKGKQWISCLLTAKYFWNLTELPPASKDTQIPLCFANLLLPGPTVPPAQCHVHELVATKPVLEELFQRDCSRGCSPWRTQVHRIAEW